MTISHPSSHPMAVSIPVKAKRMIAVTAMFENFNIPTNNPTDKSMDAERIISAAVSEMPKDSAMLGGMSSIGPADADHAENVTAHNAIIPIQLNLCPYIVCTSYQEDQSKTYAHQHESVPVILKDYYPAEYPYWPRCQPKGLISQA